MIVDSSELHSILKVLGERVPPASQLVLVGGSALILLGSPRPTLDIDFYGDDIHPEIRAHLDALKNRFRRSQ